MTEIDALRKLVQKIYHYGCYTRDDIIDDLVGPTSDETLRNKKYNACKKTVDKYLSTIRSLYFCGEEKSPLIKTRPHGDKYTGYQLKRDYFSGSTSVIADVFGLSSITSEELIQTIQFMSLVSRNDGLRQIELEKYFSYDSDLSYTTTDDIKETDIENTAVSIFKRRRNALRNAGLITSETPIRLQLPFRGMDDHTLIRLYYFASFYAGAGYPRLEAVRLRDAIKREIVFRDLPVPPDAFLFRENACGNMLDEEFVYRLLESCQNHTVTELLFAGGRTLSVHPICLKVDPRYGRWYLFAVCSGKASIFRVSRIESVVPQKEQFDYRSERTIVDDLLRQIQYSVPAGAENTMPVTVEAILHFSADYQRQLFVREMTIGEIRQEKGNEIYHAELLDPVELKPFLRSFCDCVTVLPSKYHTLDRDIAEEAERMLAKYER